METQTEQDLVQCWCGKRVARDVRHYPGGDPENGPAHLPATAEPLDPEQDRLERLGRWTVLTDAQAATLARLGNQYLQGIPHLDPEDGTLAYLRPQGAAEALEAAARSGRLSQVGGAAVCAIYARVKGLGEREADAQLPRGPGICQACGLEEVEYPDEELCPWCLNEEQDGEVDW